jgi:2-dehydro-3-deoxyphosphogluconate aldolase/(4S)-4-hydroxy-2-oxoglutarate aldolase
MEVTFDQADPDCVQKTCEAISMLREKMGDDMLFGAGTVLSTAQVDAAHKAGAEYIISPNVSLPVIARTKELGLVSIPGAMTPSEMVSAHEAGADFVKVFPVSDLGTRYIKSVMAPINHIMFVATGGVNEQNVKEYLDMGFVGAGIGGRLTERKLIEAGDFAEFTRRAKAFANIAEQKGN